MVMEPSEPSEKSKRISLSRRKWQLDRDKENQPDFSDQGIQDGGGHHEAGSTNYIWRSLVSHHKRRVC